MIKLVLSIGGTLIRVLMRILWFLIRRIFWPALVWLVKKFYNLLILVGLALREIGPIILKSLSEAIWGVLGRAARAVFTQRGFVALIGGTGSGWITWAFFPDSIGAIEIIGILVAFLMFMFTSGFDRSGT